MAATGAVLLSAAASAIEEAPDAVDFEAWTLRPGTRLAAQGKILETVTGGATSPEADFLNGSIEYEVQVSGHRSFVYTVFRSDDEGNREEIYFRPHKSNLPDALQYSPAIRGTSQWQIFHGDAGTATVALPASHWIPVRLVVEGRRLAVFVGNTQEPSMLVDLTHEPQPGRLAFSSFVPEGSEAPYGARFRNVRISEEVTFDFDEVAPPDSDPAIVRGWQVSEAFSSPELLFDALPEVDEAAWKPAVLEPDGKILLHRLALPADVEVAATVARLEIDSAEATIRSLDLGWSDAVSVFLNGRPLISIDQSYRFDRPRVQGVMGLHQARIHLPLKRGKNELRIVVADVFGGWGLMGRWVDD